MAASILKRLLLQLISLYVLLLGYLYFAQRTFIYLPQYTKPVLVATNYELQNDGMTLRGWALHAESDNAIIYFGGNGEGVERNLPRFRKMFQGKAIYLVSYRGYGNSDGDPSEAGIYADALALYDKIHVTHGTISVIGRSLGSGVATYVAANREVDKLVLVTPFDSLENIAQRKFPIVPVKLLLNDTYRSDERVKQIKSETLIIYAGNDRVVSESSTKRLIAEFVPEQLSVTKIKDAGHNSISDFDDYEKGLLGFFGRDTN